MVVGFGRMVTVDLRSREEGGEILKAGAGIFCLFLILFLTDLFFQI